MAVENVRRKRFGFLDRKRERDGVTKGGESSAGSGDNSTAGIIDSTASNSSGVDASPEPSGVSPNADSEVGNDVGASSDSSTPDGGNRDDGGDSPDRGSGGIGAGESSPDSAPRRRGRHPANCDCPRHGNGSRSDGEETGTRKESKGNDPESSSVEFGDLFGFGSKGKKSKPEAAVASLYKMGFDVASFSPLGQHWAISATEAMNLGRYTVAAIDSVSPSAKAKFSRLAEKNLPWIALAVTGAVITIPRVQLTREMIRLQREQMTQLPNLQNGGNPNNAPERANRANSPEGTIQDKRPANASPVLGAGASIVDGNFNPEAGAFFPRSSGRVV